MAAQSDDFGLSRLSLSDDKPPAFGHPLLKYFQFDPNFVPLNHGSYGSLPRPVREAVDRLNDSVESCPDRFHRAGYKPLLASARQRVAALIGAQTDECVLVANTSHGLNTVLRNFAWRSGDVIVEATTTYGSIHNTLVYLHTIHPTTVLSTFPLAFPTTHAAIIESFRKHLRGIPRPQPSEANPEPKVVAVIDGIISLPGVLLPWKEMVQICREEGVISVVDSAHSIGQEVGINLGEVKPDFWVSNCHKWLYAKRGCAVLYVPERNRHMIKTSFPTSFSYSPTDDSLESWLAGFEWTGTIDFAPYLSINAALDFREWLGGEKAINDYCHDLAMRGGRRLAELLGTSLLDESGELTMNMVNVELPLPGDAEKHQAYVFATLQQKLFDDWNVFAYSYYHNGKYWTRASTQVFNEISDFEHLAKAYNAICAEIREKIRADNGKL